MNDTEKIIKAFPAFLTEEVIYLLNKISLIKEYPDSGDAISNVFAVTVNNEGLEIPSRIYFKEPNERNLTETESIILNCLFTRHHNGFIRQQRLEQILQFDNYWITPFVFQLLGEYVIEILDIIEKNLSDQQIDNFARFVQENPVFFEKTKYRITSYWDCYYRKTFYRKNDYVGFQILERLESKLQVSN